MLLRTGTQSQRVRVFCRVPRAEMCSPSFQPSRLTLFSVRTLTPRSAGSIAATHAALFTDEPPPPNR